MRHSTQHCADRTRTTLSILTAAAAVAATTLAVAPAGAAYPGSNGAIVYSSARDGDRDLYTRTVSATGQVTHARLTDTAVDEVNAVYSPDGAFVAFLRGDAAKDTGDIWVMTSSGTNARQITSTPTPERDITWSPDGTRLAFSALVGTGRHANYEVFTVAATGAAEPVNITNSLGYDASPAWSSRDVIAFLSYRDRTYGLFTMTPTGGSVTHLPVDIGLPRQPAWSPDGSSLAFSAWVKSDSTIFVRSSTGAVTQITNGSSDFAPAWSPDGTKLVFTRIVGNGKNSAGRLFTVDPVAGSTPVGISDGEGPGDWNPDWQPVPRPGGTTPDPSCGLPICLL